MGGYEGRPTDSQVARAGALAHELADVIGEFTTLTGRELPAINRGLQAKKAEALHVISEDEWRKADGNGAALVAIRLPLGPLF